MKVNRNGKKFNITKKKKKGKKGYPTLKKKPKMNANETRSPEAIAIDGGLMSFNQFMGHRQLIILLIYWNINDIITIIILQ